MAARLTALGVLSVAAAALMAQGGQRGTGAADGDRQLPTFVTGLQYVRVDVSVTRDGHLA